MHGKAPGDGRFSFLARFDRLAGSRNSVLTDSI
jgi:hypothetical protein